jgi:5'-nucleotidase
VISGMRVSWDSRRSPGQRVLEVWLLREMAESVRSNDTDSGQVTPRYIDAEEIKPTKTGRKYKIVTREYMAQGHDGFSVLQGNTYLIDDENGQMMSSLVRKYFLGKHVHT